MAFTNQRGTLMRTTIPILLYHGVPRVNAGGGDGLAVPVARFAEHLDVIAGSGRRTLTVGEVAAALRGEHPLPERAVAITFDDGYDDTLAAIEMLCERRLRTTLYVTTGQIGAPSMIGHEQLQTLGEWGAYVEIGAHTVTHPHLDELPAPTVDRELSQSKEVLEQALRRRVDTFAYPYGAYDQRVRQAVVDAGFSSAAAVKNALSHGEDDPWAIARWTVDASTTAQRIAEVLEGDTVPTAWRHERLRTRGYRAVRKLRRRTGLRAGSSR
jgi:peptidoglycan/xylan/chitin deacetylase (PgdA/CDA1 family)